MANDTQNSSEGAPSHSHLFGVPLVISDTVPSGVMLLASFEWDHRLGRNVIKDAVTVVNLG